MQSHKYKTGIQNKFVNPKFHSGTQEHGRSKKHSNHIVNYENDYIFWCHECNVPLLEPQCFTCKNDGIGLQLSQPADVRFCSPFERKILANQLVSTYGCDPLGDRIILLNKIPGDDKTDEVIVDGLHFGVLRFDLSIMDYKFDLLSEGAKILLAHTENKTVVTKRSTRHLSGKNIGFDQIENYTDDIKKGNPILVVSGKLTGFGTAYTDSSDFSSTQGAVLKIKKIDSNPAVLNEKIPNMDDIVNANLPYIRQLGKNAMNTIKGIANQKQHQDLPVHVSFSGGKDSLVVLDLAQSALKNKSVKAFIVNTGLEFPETIDFARDYCKQNNIDLHEADAGEAFWEHLENFGPPAKDFRWCCKVCKLAPASTVIEECAKNSAVCLTIDGKRKHESFSRARVAASEMNPFVPDQLNIFPIRDWRAIEVWLYIHWRGLAYNPLYDMGFERVGCYMCPAALSAEYKRMGELHPEMYDRWNNYLLEWAKSHGLSDEFIEHGFWRWKELPPKMLKLAEELGIGITPAKGGDGKSFSIHVTSGVSPCKAGGFSVEGIVRGVSTIDAANVMNIIGKNVYSEELGMLRVEADDDNYNYKGGINMFATGSILVNANTKEEALALFKDCAKQLMRVNKCTKCGICIKVCPADAIRINNNGSGGSNGNGGLQIDDSCTKCGKCTEACVVIKYFDKLMPDSAVLSKDREK
ncbi:MAG: phosphoadenosine phosphosulfate reductase family protein [Methanosarcinaceae archaeon]|nr:phosphoadenosine phosphosulfate reductase family protein [Methanosarcinaceae archaeon]